MDLLVLNKDLDPISIVDTYSSLIWTDRYQEYGDFELYKAMSLEVLEHIKQDYYLWRKDSEHVMIIEDIKITTSAEEGPMINVTGRSLESILDRRIIWGLKTLNGNLQDAIKTLLTENVINPSKPERKIDNFIFEASTDPLITGLKIEAQYTGDNLYDTICNICVERGLGFKVTINAKKQFVFKLYSGTDRSYNQTKYPYVVFSPNFENFLNGEYYESKSSMKNVTLVGGEGEGSERRYTAVGNTSGLDRRELFTDARDVSSDSDEDITSLAVFTEFPSQVFKESSKSFVSDSNFNSSTMDVSAYAGRTISITIPQYTNASGAASGYATVLLDASKKYVATVQTWEAYNDTANRGTLKTYEFLLPDDVKYIYTSMFSQSAINSDVYYGETTDFECLTVKLSRGEYIAQLRQRGKEKLAENPEVTSFEGEAETTTMFRYGEHFFDGDIVQIADDYGHETKARVVEIITSDDESGFTMYPTFSTVSDDPVGSVILTNLIKNGNLTSDTTSWTLDKVTRTKEGGFTFAPGVTAMAQQPMDVPIVGHMYYGRCMQKASSKLTTADRRFEWYGSDTPDQLMVFAMMEPTNNVWAMASAILSVTDQPEGTWVIRNFVVNANETCYRKELLIVDLTEAFGAGREPSKEWCDTNIPFFDGTYEIG